MPISITIRPSILSDLPYLLDIYNAEVTGGFSTFDFEPWTLEKRRVWFDEHQTDKYILLTADDASLPVGYASLSPYRRLDAYSGTVELSVYVDRGHRRRGIASALMEAVIGKARENPDINTVVSVITSGNEASKRLHDRFGFAYCGTMPDVGVKFGQRLGIDNYVLSVR
ncbi:MAG: GNAT family N-acetyltransferase [Clostridiales bacterium]|nr:GNAT family N-acetyltransferase [Clostridiales bacterium]